jgi:hypothetical protein
MRRLFLICSAASFVLCLVTVVVWNAAASEYTIERWGVLPSPNTPRLHGWEMDGDGLSFESLAPQNAPAPGPTLPAAQSQLSRSGGVTTYNYSVARNPQVGTWENGWPQTDRKLLRFRLIRQPCFVDEPVSPFAFIVGGTTARPLMVGYYFRFTVPFWAVVIATAILPLVAIPEVKRSIRALEARRRGLCRKCGYDLRASSERCPECGTIVVAGKARD